MVADRQADSQEAEVKLVSSEQMTAIDARAQSDFSIPGVVLMESAGGAAWNALKRSPLLDTHRRIVFVAGTGNNGGDALVMARYCSNERRYSCEVVLARSSMRGDAAAQLSMIEATSMRAVAWAKDAAEAEAMIAGAEIVVDGLAGTGIRGPLRSPQSDIASAINRSTATVFSIDAPSGAGDGFAEGPVVQADHTLTLGLPKRCLFQPRFRGYCGEIHVVPFTLPPELTACGEADDELLHESDLVRMLPAIVPTAHKGTRGRLEVFAGSPGTTGAAVLSSEAALAAGAGLVTVHASASIYPILAGRLVSVMVRSEDQEPARTTGSTALVGPGWGTDSRRREQLETIIGTFERGVIDADALTILAERKEHGFLNSWVLTPHPGELARLAGESLDWVLDDLHRAVTTVASRYQAVVVGKSAATMIGSPDGTVAVADNPNPAMGTAGSGDVLAGVIAAQLARGLSVRDAACAGVLLHACAGRQCADSSGLFLSEALCPEISRVAGKYLLGRGNHEA